jgi:hypothetical protein
MSIETICLGAIVGTILKEILVNVLILGVIGGTAVTVWRENVDVWRTTLQISRARKKLKTGDPKRIRHAVQTLLEIAVAKPFRRQEMIEIIVEDFFRYYFRRNGAPSDPTPAPMVEAFVEALKSVLGLPRADDNGHSLNIDLHQIRLASHEKLGKPIYLEKMNFTGVELWGCDFTHVDFSRSTFQNANLGGTCFRRCGMEFLQLDEAKISYSFLDHRPTTLENCMLAGSNLDKVSLLPGTHEAPQLHIIHGIDLDGRVADVLRQRGARIE